MKRIFISSDDPSCKDSKLLRFQESIKLDVLILNVANKLGVEVCLDLSIQDRWELRLNDFLIKNSDQINAGDHILLVRKSPDSYALGVVEEVSDDDKKPVAKGSTVAEEDNDNDSDDEFVYLTGKWD
jgi:hypothetical protein